MRRTALVSALAMAVLLTPAVAAAAPAAETWAVDLATVDADDTNVRTDGGRTRLGTARTTAASAAPPTAATAGTAGTAGTAAEQTREGTLVDAPRQLAAPADVITAVVDADRQAGADVLVDVRGTEPDGTWGEWTAAGDRFAAPAATVQARVTLIGAPTVRSVRLTATTAPAAPAATLAVTPQAAPLGYQVYATREGLVGRTTANGHVITERDHFVALPSRRGLAPRDTGDYSVKVCHANGRCAWAPVWDVGPWNTRDDYWNPPGVRQNWGDLPQGRPQAQAAIQNGYNGGLDQYGRVVRNAAGIDLADGTFWDGLGLTNNAWITVTYLWTGSGAVGTVAAPLLNVRSTPDTTRAPVGLAGRHARVHVECHVYGQWATGTQGRTNVWVRISASMYVSKAHIAGPVGPHC